MAETSSAASFFLRFRRAGIRAGRQQTGQWKQREKSIQGFHKTSLSEKSKDNSDLKHNFILFSHSNVQYRQHISEDVRNHDDDFNTFDIWFRRYNSNLKTDERQSPHLPLKTAIIDTASFNSVDLLKKRTKKCGRSRRNYRYIIQTLLWLNRLTGKLFHTRTKPTDPGDRCLPSTISVTYRDRNGLSCNN